MTKVCSKCRIDKPDASFGVRGDRPGKRLRPKCRECEKALIAKYRAENPEKVRAAHAKRRAENPEKGREAAARYRARHPEALQRDNENRRKRGDEVRARARELYEENRDHIRARKARNRQTNPAVRERERKYIASLPRDVRQAKWKAVNDRKRSTPEGRIANSVRVRVHRELTRKSPKTLRTFEILGYSVDELRAHLERQFQPDMTWANYGRGGWHIDHIVPMSAHHFKSEDDIDFKRAWALENLQPLWEAENLSKGAKLSAPFQPSLAIGGALG